MSAARNRKTETDAGSSGSDDAPVRWYARGIRFECQKCGQCCRGEPGVVWVSQYEIKRIAEHLGLAKKEFRRKYLRRVGFRVSLKEYDNGDCFLYEDGCVAYPVRPRQCQTFPFWPDALRSRKWFDRMARGCPGIGKGKLYTCEEIETISRKGSMTGESDGDY